MESRFHQTDDNETTLDKAGKTMTAIFGTTFEYHNFVSSAMIRVCVCVCVLHPWLI